MIFADPGAPALPGGLARRPSQADPASPGPLAPSRPTSAFATSSRAALHEPLSFTQVQNSLKFNSIPAWAGLEGLEAVLCDAALDSAELVSLVRRDANRGTMAPTAEAAREFLGQIVLILRRQLGADNEPEVPMVFSTDFVFTLPSIEGRVERLLCLEMMRVEADAFALFVSEGSDGPCTIYKFEMFPGPRMTYELVTDEATRVRILGIYEACLAKNTS